MEKKQYRSSNMIIQNILEAILREKKKNPVKNKGIKKSHLISFCNLKTYTAEKYLIKMTNAGYIEHNEESWGERIINIYNITKLGKERYEWFVKINTEIS
ncbi:MAG: hypothetical protein JXA99_11015 [Candidatus Lokiarchaeota archaeon]|nr:hypothetical protein [Candidatus Lokiarchaeota archaeon]